MDARRVLHLKRRHAAYLDALAAARMLAAGRDPRDVLRYLEERTRAYYARQDEDTRRNLAELDQFPPPERVPVHRQMKKAADEVVRREDAHSHTKEVDQA